ncbi:MAG: DUF937 domain-containing protein [Treponema sp.]|nr:DUF937 domain-containing protein [Treponema sp.]
MDASSILTALLSTSNIKNIGKASGASTDQVKSVLTSALPTLLSGASTQANTASTAAGFLQALTSHAGDSASKIDLGDGAKILSHLLGSSQAKNTTSIAKASGVEKSTVTSILAAAAPLLLSVLGKQSNDSGMSGNALGSLLGGLTAGNMGSLLTGLLGGTSSSATSSSASSSSSKPGKKPAAKKPAAKKPAAKKDSDTLSQVAGLVGSLLTGK